MRREPWAPELRAERESLCLLHILRAQVHPQFVWLSVISSDETLSDLRSMRVGWRLHEISGKCQRLTQQQLS